MTLTAVLLSPVWAFLMAIAVEILIDILIETGTLAFPAFLAAGTIVWRLLGTLRRSQGGVPVET